jgi:hypothetical protein
MAGCRMVGCWWTGGWRSAAVLAASRLPALWLTAAEQVDLGALASGAYSPLVGVPGAREHAW